LCIGVGSDILAKDTMNPLWILLIGVAVIVGGILILRLHTFLALIAGALAVAALTPNALVYRFTLRSGEIHWTDSGDGTVEFKSKTTRLNGSPLLALALTKDGYQQVATLQTTGTRAHIVSGQPIAHLNPGDILIDPALQTSAATATDESIGQRVADGFGKNAQQVGILIAMAALLGQTLMESGAAERIVLSLRQAFGNEHSSLAFLVSGFILAALVLSDTTFYLLIPLAQVMRVRSGKDYLLYVLAIVAGAVMSHSLVPPATGPLFVATALNINLSTMILGGIIIGSISSSAGYLYALWANRRWVIPLRGAIGLSTEELDRIATREEKSLPPMWLSVLPIILPVLLITGGDLVATGTLNDTLRALHIRNLITTLGDRNVAMMVGAAIGLVLVWTRPDKRSSKIAAGGSALASAGVMILIISAGGAFGYVVQQTDVANTITNLMPASKLALLPLAFIVTMVVRTAQGSAIVAMTTAVGVVGPIAAAGALGFHPVYLALAIGCGSKPFPWMNDAGFWIIAKASGMTEGETIKTSSVMMCIMGFVGLAATMVGAYLFPFH
jgi:GntP family gluconate:H+ symporter